MVSAVEDMPDGKESMQTVQCFQHTCIQLSAYMHIHLSGWSHTVSWFQNKQALLMIVLYSYPTSSIVKETPLKIYRDMYVLSSPKGNFSLDCYVGVTCRAV